MEIIHPTKFTTEQASSVLELAKARELLDRSRNDLVEFVKSTPVGAQILNDMEHLQKRVHSLENKVLELFK